LLAISFLICFGLICKAQAPVTTAVPAQTPVQTPDLAGIAHAAIRVSDLAKAREFYEKLGFEEAFQMNQGGSPTEAFLKVNDRQFLELYPQREAAQTTGFMHVCFESADLEGLNRYYVAHGLKPKAVRRAGAGNLLFTMEGPENQNIEYTQYMPGSKHTLDRGLHLGANRVSEHILAVGIEMQDPVAALNFYKEKLAFTPARSSPPGESWLSLPGSSGEEVAIVQHRSGSAFELIFSVPDGKRTASQLKALQIPVEKSKSMLTIHDPDGNRIVFLVWKPA
jgi:catechol 2,3-dioxygenase-like lactoylglutathione lyase family enzyme